MAAEFTTTDPSRMYGLFAFVQDVFDVYVVAEIWVSACAGDAPEIVATSVTASRRKCARYRW
jgi:hypothetical protein